MASTDLRRDLTLLDSTMINVGSMIGSAIFIVPAVIALYLQSGPLIMTMWVAGGIISLFGALAIAELGGMMPRAGGQYVFLREIYGPLWGFLYGWTAFIVIISGSISAIAVAFATYLAYFFPMDDASIKITAIASIVLLTLVNCFGVKLGALIQNGLTFIKIGSLFLLGLLCMLLTDESASREIVMPDSLPGSFSALLVAAMVAVLWAYDGWIEITFVAGEVKDPERNIHRSLAISMILVIALYALVNAGYLAVLPLETMAGSLLVASDAMEALMGPPGAAIIAAAVVISTFGANNGFVITGARIYYAMAKERLFFESFGKVHARFATPIPSLLGQGLWASLLVLTGTYEELFTYVVFASWIFYAMSCTGVMILRKRLPDVSRPYRTWGYPVTPVIFISFSIILVVVSILENPKDSLVGLGMILSGAPAYWYWSRKSNRG